MPAATDGTEHKERLSKLFDEVNGLSETLNDGFLTVNAKDQSAQVQLVWGKKDLINNTTNNYHVQYHANGLDNEHENVQRGLFPSSWDVSYTSVSPSKKYVVTLKLDKGSDPNAAPDGVFFVYSDSKLIKTFRTPKSTHGAIYLGEREGGLAWSQDETKIAYIAEKKPQESPPFYENVNSATSKKKKEESKDNDEEPKPEPGDKFVYEEDWGEQYVGKKTGVIFLATLATGKIEEVKGTPSNITCADVAFTPNDEGLVFCGTETDAPKRLGIIYCYNRPIHLYHLVFNQEDPAKNVVTKLDVVGTDETSREIGTIRSPRFSSDGKKLALVCTRDVVTHSTVSFLCVMEWATKETSTVVDIVEEPEANYTSNGATAFNGLFMGSLSKNAWSSDGKYIFFTTQMGSRVVWKYVDVATKHIHSPQYLEGDNVAVETVLDRVDNWVLVSVSSPTRPSSVFLVHIDFSSGKYLRSPITIADQNGLSSYVKEWKLYPIPTSVSDSPAASKQQPDVPASLKEADLVIPQVYSTSDYEAAVILPRGEAPPNGFPVVLELHGGPHGNSPVMYRVFCEYLAALGFVCITVNYRGSTGYGRMPLESLVGKVGTQDIFDCHYALLHLLDKTDLPLDRTKVHCSGGSHGGFIVTHLIAQFPGFYKSMVTRNPVTNIATMFPVSDIPDWGLAVTGIRRFEGITTTQKLQKELQSLPPVPPATRMAIHNKLWQHSPISNDLSKVVTPSLFGIGAKDRRVPPYQGLEYRDAIRAYGVTTRTLWYPEDCHPLGSVAAYGDFTVNWALWLVQHNN